jgi:hypothetical protein
MPLARIDLLQKSLMVSENSVLRMAFLSCDEARQVISV